MPVFPRTEPPLNWLSPRKRGPRVVGVIAQQLSRERSASSGPPLSRGKHVGRCAYTVLFLLAVLPFAIQQTHAQASSDALLKRVVDEIIVPGYGNLVRAADGQQEQWQ